MNIDTLYPSLKPLTHKYGEDIVQKALLKVWRLKPDVFDLPEPELVAFITKAAYNVMCKEMVKLARERDVIEEVYSKDTTYLDPELVALLKSELSKAEGKCNRTYRRYRQRAMEAIV